MGIISAVNLTNQYATGLKPLSSANVNSSKAAWRNTHRNLSSIPGLSYLGDIKNYTDTVNNKGQCSFQTETYEVDGMEMTIVPGFGANLASLKLDGTDILSSPLMSGSFKGKHSASGYGGTPFITPPNRFQKIYFPEGSANKEIDLSAEAQGELKDKNYRSSGDYLIHGRMFRLPWQNNQKVQVKLDENGQARGIKVAYTYDTSLDENLSSSIGNAKFTLTYTLERNPDTGAPELIVDTDIENLGNGPHGSYPLVGFGFHPYLKTDQGSAFSVPASKIYMNGEGDQKCIPTGEIKSVKEAGNHFDLRQAQMTDSGINYDHVFTDLNFTEQRMMADGSMQQFARSQITRDGGRRIVYVDQSGIFNHATVCTNKGSICIEPQTCPTDASRLAHEGKYSFDDLIYLKPGEYSKPARFIIGLQK